MSLNGGTQVLSQFHNIVRWFYHATPPGHPIIPAPQWRCRCICLWRPGARRPANALSPQPRSFHPRENLAKLVRKERGKEGREPNKEMQSETGRSLPLGAFRLALLLAPKLVMRRGRGLPSGPASDVALRVQGSAHPSVGVIGQGGLLRKCQKSGANSRSPY